MQPVGPYRFTEVMGVCQVGKVWWAVDGQDRLVTVAVLEGAAATDQPWREAFANAANAMALTSGGQRYLNADFAAATPWVAYPSEEGLGAQRLFQSLGMDLHPAESEPEVLVGESGAVAQPPESVSGVPTSGVPTSGAPLPWAMHAAVVPHQVSSPPQQVSPAPQQVSSPPLSEHPQPVSVPPQDPFTSPERRIIASEPPRRRTRLWAGIGALVLVVVAGVGGAIVWAAPDDPGQPETTPSSGSALLPEPAASPQSPGLEPPRQGTWPTQWPRFTEQDAVNTLPNLEGLGFPVKVPLDWQCTLAGRAEGFVKYTCGTPASGGQAIGGELIVRDCQQPCDAKRQTAMRRAEDAWGLQWTRGGRYVTYAESSQLQIEGEQRYGLVVVAYWRGGSSGQLDHQLVFRMTAPVDGAGRLRRVANYLRDVAVF
ncbi:hypothetical protein GA0074695_5752 [Micromonospora viridifaciens]|uniref:Uncharacterized protein n=1 Tax=Micromonospora viridifaciens TaxID=1881 RepID=A0A1C4ZKF7_MICVI|nr:hypothetical protein [Micromonospora viridifaciens]SCF33567.1 hypothetical protein GA0074695_5752 [Micromonospora viridifaciens]